MNKTKSDYGIKIAMFIDDPKYLGTLDASSVEAQKLKYFTFQYGGEGYDYDVTFHWAVEPYENVIKEAKYTYHGPLLGIAVFHMLSVVLVNKNINQLKSVSFNAIEKLLRDNPHIPAIDEEEAYVIAYAIDALKQAIDKYTHTPVEYDNVTPLCPEHSPLSIASTRTLIAQQEISDLKTFYHFTHIDTTTDETCQKKVDELIETVQHEIKERQAIEEALQSTPFEELSEQQRIVAAETAIDQTVREYLVMDGGDIEILAVKDNNDTYDVYISYLGACSSCESSGGTLVAIENALRDKLHPHIRVISI